MTNLVKVKVRWAGFNGSPGWSNFYFKDFTATGEPTQADADGAATRVADFFGAVKVIFPATVNTTVQNDIEVINDVDGKLQNVFTTTSRSAVAGTNTGTNFSGPSGMVVTWRTAGVVAGRRVRGRTFLVPIAASAYETDGTINPSTITAVQTAATALANQTGAPDLYVWARPKINPETKAVIRSGTSFPVTGATVPDMAAILKSRRD